VFSVEAMVRTSAFCLPMHALAEEIPEDGIFSPNSPFRSGRAIYQ